VRRQIVLKYALKTDEKSFTAILKNLLCLWGYRSNSSFTRTRYWIVTLTGELVRIQMKKKGVNPTSNEVAKFTEKHLKKILIFGQ
jgi:hypothetical protein